jgi:hypothetical protein
LKGFPGHRFPGGNADVAFRAARADVVVDHAARGPLRPSTAHARAVADPDLIAQTATDGPGLLRVECTGAALVAALERAVARYPAWCDDFPHVSAGLRVAFDPRRVPGQRLGPRGVALRGAPVDRAATYAIATTPRFARAAFLGSAAPRGPATVAVDASDGPSLPALLRNLLVDAKALRAPADGKALALTRRTLAKLAAPGGCLRPTPDGGFALEPEARAGRVTVL